MGNLTAEISPSSSPAMLVFKQIWAKLSNGKKQGWEWCIKVSRGRYHDAFNISSPSLYQDSTARLRKGVPPPPSAFWQPNTKAYPGRDAVEKESSRVMP